jgi:hypothetical protein
MDRNEWLIPTFQLHVRGGVVFPSRTCRAAAGRPKSHISAQWSLHFKNSSQRIRSGLQKFDISRAVHVEEEKILRMETSHLEEKDQQ